MTLMTIARVGVGVEGQLGLLERPRERAPQSPYHRNFTSCNQQQQSFIFVCVGCRRGELKLCFCGRLRDGPFAIVRKLLGY